jgi:uncharacterized protein involved in exopolysaccharide biosynthesis
VSGRIEERKMKQFKTFVRRYWFTLLVAVIVVATAVLVVTALPVVKGLAGNGILKP